jgi:hypothetical protein
MQTQWRGAFGEKSNIMGEWLRYPPLVIRPPLFGDEKEPQFSDCTVPFVFFKSHEDNYYHVMVSTLPQLYSFLADGMVGRDVTYVVRPFCNRQQRSCGPLLK